MKQVTFNVSATKLALIRYSLRLTDHLSLFQCIEVVIWVAPKRSSKPQ